MEELIEKTDAFVLNLFKNELDEIFIYHNYNHTLRVVKSTKEIIANSQIDVKEANLLLLAAWLHDTGYVHGAENHEQHSVKIATQFLHEQNVEPAIIEQVNDLILATEFKFHPTDKLQEILRDADSSHFAKDYYQDTSTLLRKELQLRNNEKYSRKQWRKENIVFTTKHQYYTPYAIKNWSKGKSDNLIALLKDKKKQKNKYKKEEVKVKLKNASPERAIQTLFRTTLRNHLKLSDIADTKANILLSVNAIIISLALANLIPKLEQTTNRHLLWPTLILVLFSVASIILSIMSTKPNVTSGDFTDEQVKNKQVNLLFFGNFHKVPFDRYKKSLMSMLDDKEEVYESLLKDLWLLGVVLNRKYLLLRWTYTIFMIGIIASVAAFVISFYMLDFEAIAEITAPTVTPIMPGN